jgi:hypothetical protein
VTVEYTVTFGDEVAVRCTVTAEDQLIPLRIMTATATVAFLTSHGM